MTRILRLFQTALSSHRSTTLAVLGFFLIALVLLARTLLTPYATAYPYQRFFSDVQQFIAFENAIRHALANGEFPLWNRYSAGGTSLFGNPQAAVLYPFLILLRWLPYHTLFNINAVIHLWLIGVGTYLLLRDVPVSRSAAFFGGVSFMLCGMVVSKFLSGLPVTIHAIAWAPWILWQYRRLLDRPSWNTLLATVLFVALEILAGNPPYMIYVLVLPGAYYVFEMARVGLQRRWQDMLRMTVSSAGVGLLTGGLLAVQLLPTAELIGLGSRISGFNAERIENGSLGLHNLITFVVPYAFYDVIHFQSLGFNGDILAEFLPYVGLLPLLLTGLLLTRKQFLKDPFRLYLVLLALLGIALAMRNGLLHGFLTEQASFLRVHGRFIFLTSFSLSLLGAIGLDDLTKHKPDRDFKRLIWLGAAGTALALTGFLAFSLKGTDIVRSIQAAGYFDYIEASHLITAHSLNLRNLFIALTAITLASVLALRPVMRLDRGWLLVAALLVDLFAFSWPLMRPQSMTELYDPGNPMAQFSEMPERIRLPDPDAEQYGIPSTRGRLDGLQVSRLDELQTLETRGSALLSALMIVSDTSLEEPGYQLLETRGGAYLYEHVDNLPRVYAVPAVTVVTSDSEALDYIADPDFDPFAEAVVTVEDGQGPDLPQNTGAILVDVALTRYGTNSLSATVTADGPVLVIFSEMAYPGWTAQVDGLEMPMWLANYAFRGVAVDAGTHTIELIYRPRSVRTGLVISILSILIIAGVTLVFRLRPSLRTANNQAPS